MLPSRELWDAPQGMGQLVGSLPALGVVSTPGFGCGPVCDPHGTPGVCLAVPLGNFPKPLDGFFGQSLSRMVQGARGPANALCPAREVLPRNHSQGWALGSHGVPGERGGHTGCATSCWVSTMMSPQFLHGAGGSSSRHENYFSSQIDSKHFPGADKFFLCVPQTSQPCRGLSQSCLPSLEPSPNSPQQAMGLH